KGQGAAAERDQGVRADVEGELESAAAGVDEATLQVFALRERDGMDEDVEASPALASLREERCDLRVVLDVARPDEIGSDLRGERPDAPLERFADEGQAERRPLTSERSRDGPGDAALVRDPEDERALC